MVSFCLLRAKSTAALNQIGSSPPTCRLKALPIPRKAPICDCTLTTIRFIDIFLLPHKLYGPSKVLVLLLVLFGYEPVCLKGVVILVNVLLHLLGPTVISHKTVSVHPMTKLAFGQIFPGYV